ncbi:DUF2334 domain-containing protein [Exiguobacterium sp. SL-10]|uniref:DUF2334 domain-containing protein n=1 Tax=Exiguobacterium sp. SL-10 TaxID=2510962 RepID=UPI00103E6088|nr:DUF2334 domain-containing protein [Exiguobacterium sp. SL-10]TCI30412.1 DUF2334 domain-containing protein [Exiguobacterium sp. SL-10]
MRYKIWFFSLLLLLLPSTVHAATPTVAIVYSSTSIEIPPEVYKLEALVSRFSNEIMMVRDIDVDTETLAQVDSVLYYGLSTTSIPDIVREEIEAADVPVYAIGHNATQLTMFAQLDMSRVAGASQFYQSRTDETVTFPLADVITTVEGDALFVHASLMRNGKATAVIVQTGPHFYAGIDNLLSPSSILLADTLFDFFSVEANDGHTGYLRLEDINPSSDPALVEAVGNRLLDRGVPILLAVIPVYTDEESGQRIQLSDRKELVDVLRQLEARGASVLAHGYTHQYRSSETGEGFEFWDVENNQPVFVPSTENPPQLLGREAFPSEEAYLTYLEPLLEDEANYIRTKLTRSIHELVSLGLHPLGFEAPHYTMSHSGYAVTAEQFTNVFGQVQWSNTNWEVMGATPFVSKPALLDGMTLYPETIGYIRTDIPRPIDEMRRALNETLLVRESMLGAFYHPYIGMEYVDDVVDLMESVPGFKWLDLRAQNERVMTEDVSIRTNDARFILQDERNFFMKQFHTFLPTSFFERMLMGLALITFFAVMAFLTYTLYLRSQRKQRLFKERD